jgi:hypothetical protein
LGSDRAQTQLALLVDAMEKELRKRGIQQQRNADARQSEKSRIADQVVNSCHSADFAFFCCHICNHHGRAIGKGKVVT